MEQQKMIQILDRYLAGTATETEQHHIEDWLESNAKDDNEWQRMDESNRTNYITSLHQEILSTINQSGAQVYTIGTDTKRRRRMIWRMVAAASIIAIVSTLVYITVIHQQGTGSPVAITPTDIKAPESTHAVITLADGRKIYLDSAGSGTLVMQENVNVIKNEKGEIVYQATDKGPQREVAYNTLFNPRGSKVVTLALSDGTKVWLNSGSSLQYPVAFVGRERKVTITGEAYFEVSRSATAAGAKQTFSVEANGMTTTVLGTHFNVNAYEDEPETKVTLLEGSVRVSNNSGAVQLQPGQQALSAANEKPQIRKDIDTNQVMAWKNGTFNFGEGTNIKEIMRQVARWYDVDVEYKNNIQEEFGGSVPRQVNVSELLEKFELTGTVKFKIQGKKVIVSAP